MYELEVYRSFSAAHHLRGYDGDCSKLHGHNWQVTVVLRANFLDEVGIAYDFKALKGMLDELLDEYDHSLLNELPDFQAINPTSENLARTIYRKLGERINSANVKVAKVKVSESPSSTAVYYE